MIDVDGYFSLIDSPERAYWFGFIVADGNVSQDGRRLCVRLKLSDIDFLAKLGLVFGKEPKVYSNGVNKRGIQKWASELDVYSAPLVNSLVLKGVVPAKSKVVGSSVMGCVTGEYFSHFVRGFLDGDGSIRKPEVSGLVLHAYNEDFLRGLTKRIQERLPVSEVEPVKAKGGRVFIVAWYSKRDLRLFYDFLYRGVPEAILMERKRDRLALMLVRLEEKQNELLAMESQLRGLVGKMPLTRIAARFGVTDNCIRKRCLKLGIVFPKRSCSSVV